MQDDFPAVQKDVMPHGDSPTAKGGTTSSSKALVAVPPSLPSSALQTAQLGPLPSGALNTTASATLQQAYAEDIAFKLQQATADPLPVTAGEWQGGVQEKPQDWRNYMMLHNPSNTEKALPSSSLAAARCRAQTAVPDTLLTHAAQTGAIEAQSGDAHVTADLGTVSSSSNIAEGATLPSDVRAANSGAVTSVFQTAAAVTTFRILVHARAAHTLDDGSLPGVTPEVEYPGTSTAASSGQSLSLYTSVGDHDYKTKVSKLCLHTWHVQGQSPASNIVSASIGFA